MFFWVGLAVAFVVYISVVAWGARGIGKRWHKPGSQRLR
jgi:hypothetical protein